MTNTGTFARAGRRTALLVTLAAGMLTSFVAQAEFERGWYIGGGGGSYSLTDVDPTLGPQLRDESAVGTQIFGGYQLKFVALEAGYMFLNDLEGTDAGIEVTLHLDGWFGRGLLMFPFEFSPTTSVAIFAGAGVHNWKERVTVKDKTVVPTATLSDTTDSQSGSSVTAGVWIRGRHAATRLAYDLLTFNQNDHEISVWSVSFIYHF